MTGGLLGRALLERFRLDIEAIEALPVLAHNQHFVVRGAGGPFHVTLHDLPAGSEEIGQLEEVCLVASRLTGRSTRIAASIRRSIAGRYLEHTPLGHVTVRRHAGTTVVHADPRTLVEVAREHGRALLSSTPAGARLRRGRLRFEPPDMTLDAVGIALTGRLRRWLTPGQERAFRTELASVVDSFRARPRPPRPAHGDLDVSNLLLVDGQLEVIDHGCLHWDRPGYDLAHLLLASTCAGYFFGAIDGDRAAGMLDAVHPGEIGSGELLDVCRYVMLERLGSVGSAHDLRAEDRLRTLGDLGTLASAHAFSGRPTHRTS